MRTRIGDAPDRVAIPLILAVALGLRLAIIAAGGQFYWPDEDRYLQSRDFVEVVTAGQARPVATVEHLMFKAIGILPAIVESTYGPDPRIPAAFFAVFSVINIWLLAGIARRLGADAVESSLVALLCAASTSLFYFSRHLFPYDASMTFGLLALRAGIAPDASWRASLTCGAWASLCFLAYFGYWTLGGAACVIHVLRNGQWRTVVQRGALTALGLVAPLALVVGLLGGDAVASVPPFMTDVDQGTFAEGWRVPFEYLWHSEHGLFVLWMAAVAVSLAASRRWPGNPRLRVGLAGLMFIYGSLAVFSSGFGAFVVYGRLVRQLVPFLCLVTGAVLLRLAAGTPARRAFVTAAAAALVIQAAINARPVLEQQFPREFIERGEQLARRLGASRAVPLYAEHLYPPEKRAVPAGMVEALAARHPLQFVPYHYEGFTPEQRQFMRSTDIRMRLLVPRAD